MQRLKFGPRFAGLFLATSLVACRSIDLEEERLLLMQTDRAFSETAKTAGEDWTKVMHFWTDDAIMLFSGGTRRAAGKGAIQAFVKRVRSKPGFSVEWNVEGCDVAASGDLGYTWGTGRVSYPDSDGNAQVVETNYLVVWRKQADGSWRIVVDG